jgi:hypothetical protein
MLAVLALGTAVAAVAVQEAFGKRATVPVLTGGEVELRAAPLAQAVLDRAASTKARTAHAGTPPHNRSRR